MRKQNPTDSNSQEKRKMVRISGCSSSTSIKTAKNLVNIFALHEEKTIMEMQHTKLIHTAIFYTWKIFHNTLGLSSAFCYFFCHGSRHLFRECENILQINNEYFFCWRRRLAKTKDNFTSYMIIFCYHSQCEMLTHRRISLISR